MEKRDKQTGGGLVNLGDIISIVGAVISAVTVIVVVATFTRNGKKDTEDEGKATGTILTELGYIQGGIDDVKTEQREQRKTNADLLSRMVAVEASTKQAHKRIDTLEGREERKHDC